MASQGRVSGVHMITFSEEEGSSSVCAQMPALGAWQGPPQCETHQSLGPQLQQERAVTHLPASHRGILPKQDGVQAAPVSEQTAAG